MRLFAGLALLLLSGLAACASPDPWVAHCEPGARLQPSDECVALPETRALAARLDGLITGAADPLAVIVAFDEAAKPSRVCSVRSNAPRQWGGQMKLRRRVLEILETPAGPACLAGRDLVFNVSAAIVGALKAELRDCESTEAGGSGLYDRSCLEARQIVRREVWFFNSRRDYPYVFQQRDEGAKGRNQALNRCSDDIGIVETDLPQFRIGYTWAHSRLTRCMANLGWEQTL